MVSNLCPPDYDGGFELRAFQIAKHLIGRGHSVEFVTSRYRPEFKGERGDPPWVHRILHYVEPGESGPKRFARFLAMFPASVTNAEALRLFMEGREYDLGYCFGLHRIGVATHVPLVDRGIPVLWHAGDAFLAKQLKVWPKSFPLYPWFLRTFYRQAYEMEQRGDYRHIAFVSANLRDFYLASGMQLEGAYIVPRGIDFALADDVDRARAEPPTFFMACRLHAQKGVHNAVAAAVALHQRRPELDWRLEIAGKPEHPSYLEGLKKTIGEAGIEHRVAFLGQLPRDGIIEKMRTAAAFLHCSTFADPFANTIIETLAAGTPLIGSKVGSILEVVTPGESALIFERDDAATLSSHMERILTEPGLGQKLATKGVEIIRERYTIDRILDLTEEVFDEVLQAHGKKPACASV